MTKSKTDCDGVVEVSAYTREEYDVSAYTRKCGTHNYGSSQTELNKERELLTKIFRDIYNGKNKNPWINNNEHKTLNKNIERLKKIEDAKNLEIYNKTAKTAYDRMMALQENPRIQRIQERYGASTDMYSMNKPGSPMDFKPELKAITNQYKNKQGKKVYGTNNSWR